MKLKRPAFVLITVIWFILVSCQEKDPVCDQAPAVQPLAKPIEIIRADQELRKVKTATELEAYFKANPIIARHFFNTPARLQDSLYNREILSLLSNVYFDSLFMEVEAIYPDVSFLQNQLNTAFTYLQYYYPNQPVPRVKTIVSGFNADLYISDSLLIIGLDYFLGPKAKFQPTNMPQYIQQRFQKAYITPMILLLLSQRYNANNPEATSLLADMIYYGKSHYFARHMLPCSHDSLFIWYSSRELEEVRQNDHIVWANFINNELLYITSAQEKQKYLGERPNVYEMGPACPGRIGQWVGWEIVRAFMESHPQVRLQELMKMEQANTLFSESEYKPKN